MKTSLLKTTLATAALLVCYAASAAVAPSYVTVTWSDQKVHVLDAGMNDMYNFSVADTLPNGVAASDSVIYAGFFTSSSITAYDYSGTALFSWTDGRLGNLQGLALVGNELVVSSNGASIFYNANTGAYVREFANSGGSVEGLTYDGTHLWEIGDTLIARDVMTGAEVANITNAASGCSYGGTGIASAGAGALMLACNSGAWYKVSSTDGSVLMSGNNQLNMYGLDNVNAVPEPQTYAMMLTGLALAGYMARRRKAS